MISGNFFFLKNVDFDQSSSEHEPYWTYKTLKRKHEMYRHSATFMEER